MIVPSFEEVTYMMILRGNQTLSLPPFMRQILFSRYIGRIIAARRICRLFYQWAITHRRIPKMNFTGCAQNAIGKSHFFMVSYMQQDEDYDNEHFLVHTILISYAGHADNILIQHKSVRRLSLWLSQFKGLKINSTSRQRRKAFDGLECCV